MSNFFSNSSAELKQLKRNIKLWNNGKNIRYDNEIKVKIDYLRYFIVAFSVSFIVWSFTILFVLFLTLIADNQLNFNGFIQRISQFLSKSSNIQMFVNMVLFFGLVNFVSLTFPLTKGTKKYRDGLFVYINRNTKQIIVKRYDINSLFCIPIKINIPFNSNQYLPEFELPEKEMEKHQHLCQELQQAISLETGLKFDTQKFLEENKDKLKLRV